MRCAFEWRLPLSVRLRGHCFRKRSPLAHSSARVGRGREGWNLLERDYLGLLPVRRNELQELPRKCSRPQ
jgi:hypothetical protein